MNAINTCAAVFAAVATIATLGSLSNIADSQHRQVAASQEAIVAAAGQPVQQVVIVARRAPA